MKVPRLLKTSADVAILGFRADDLRLVSGTCLRRRNSVRFVFGAKRQEFPATIVLDGPASGSVRIFFRGKHPAQVRLFVYPGNGTKMDVKIVAEADSRAGIDTYVLSDRSVSTHLDRSFRLDRGASLALATMVLASGKTRIADHAVLAGETAELSAETLAVLNGSDQIDVTQEVHHDAPRTTSGLQNSIVASDTAKAAFDVTGAIAKGNAKARCHQGNRGVLLGEKAVISVSPKLLIDEFDVEAGHGCAIGRLNAEEMYYLTSRGLDAATAKRLIVSGYTAPFLEKMADPLWRRYLETKLNKKLEGGES